MTMTRDDEEVLEALRRRRWRVFVSLPEDLVPLEEHLPGKHDQSRHAQGGGRGVPGSRPRTPAERVLLADVEERARAVEAENDTSEYGLATARVAREGRFFDPSDDPVPPGKAGYCNYNVGRAIQAGLPEGYAVAGGYWASGSGHTWIVDRQGRSVDPTQVAYNRKWHETEELPKFGVVIPLEHARKYVRHEPGAKAETGSEWYFDDFGALAAMPLTEAQLVEHPGHASQKVHGRRGGFSDITPEQEAACKRFADEHRMDIGRETVEAIDRNGVTMFHRESTPNDPYGVDLDDVKDGAWAGMVLTHNHPRGMDFPVGDPRHAGNSFSGTDVKMGIDAGVAELRVVSPGYDFRLAPGEGGWPSSGKMAYAFDNANAMVRLQFYQRIDKGYPAWGKTSEERAAYAESEHFHEVWTMVSEELGMHYSREPVP